MNGGERRVTRVEVRPPDVSASPVELKNLNVHPEIRGRGAWSALAAAEVVRPRGRLAMGVGVDNPRARALCERLGNVATG